MIDKWTTLRDRLASEPDGMSGDRMVYDLAAIRSVATRVVELGSPDRVLAVLEHPDGTCLVSFVVCGFYCGPATVDGENVDGVKVDIVFHGSGPGGAKGVTLRELRHTYWGEDGYVFYPNGTLIAAAFAALGEWFDCD